MWIQMKRAVYYRQGYKIVISGNFYEVSDGKTATHFGELNHTPTLQEVWNETVGLDNYVNFTQQRIAEANRKLHKTRNMYNRVASQA